MTVSAQNRQIKSVIKLGAKVIHLTYAPHAAKVTAIMGIVDTGRPNINKIKLALIKIPINDPMKPYEIDNMHIYILINLLTTL